MKKILLFSLFLFVFNQIEAQEFSRKDSLQGGLREERTCYDVLRYDLDIRIDPEKKWIFGSNTITFKVDDDTNKIQVDLFENMIIDGIRLDNIPKIECTREFNAVFIHFPKTLKKGEIHKLRISYYGNPIIAKNAPWDGGFVFTKDKKQNP